MCKKSSVWEDSRTGFGKKSVLRLETSFKLRLKWFFPSSSDAKWAIGMQDCPSQYVVTAVARPWTGYNTASPSWSQTRTSGWRFQGLEGRVGTGEMGKDLFDVVGQLDDISMAQQWRPSPRLALSGILQQQQLLQLPPPALRVFEKGFDRKAMNYLRKSIERKRGNEESYNIISKFNIHDKRFEIERPCCFRSGGIILNWLRL